METQKNSLGHTVSLFYARYAYKTQGLVNVNINYQGNINECPKHLLEGVKDIENFKYIRIWQRES